MRTSIVLLLPAALIAGPYPPAAGVAGSDAISKDDPRFIAWANGYSEVHYGSDVDTVWRTPGKALGPATSDVYDIVCLGNGGRIVLFFPHPIRDGEGPDFAVFENAVTNTFLELAFVEVSSDGANFVRFPNASLTANPVGAFGIVDPTNLSGLAGKHRVGFGTPFDLASLPADAPLDRENIRFVRIVDIIGDGKTKDSEDRPIYDPTPTVGSGGFDLDAIGVIHQNNGVFAVTAAGIDGDVFRVEWQSNPGSSYRIETSTTLDGWQPAATMSGNPAGAATVWTTPLPGDPKRFWRVVRLDAM